MRIFEEIESNVRSYIRMFPTVFEKAKGCMVYDEQGREYLDFFAGAGTLNYGHNNPRFSEALIEYIKSDGIIHGLDKATAAKKEFLEKLRDTILVPRNMNYKVQFPGPTGTNAVETALKLARMVKGRSNVISFTNGFHGLTMGSMALTGNSFYRDEAFINRINVSFAPYEGYLNGDFDTIEYLRASLMDKSSGVDLPAAIIVETIQAEGGVNVASSRWLKGLELVCRELDILLIIDDIQVGNGRTGDFFSFEEAGLDPDIILLSKSIGGGLPLSLVLLKPEIDQWKPGEHTGTFRGNNLAFVIATEALRYWDDDRLSDEVFRKSEILQEELERMVEEFPELEMEVRGRGLIYGLDISPKGLATEISKEAFNKGMVIEVAGAEENVLKFLPPLIIEDKLLYRGLDVIEECLYTVLKHKKNLLAGGIG
ncbi:MAG: diaminobutyrate--2-oxoglutarate transaminase [Thermoleophilia bacterium]|nr:diaminobutyrate--2-oxoglutarate transaminase [Thermoleophilia bacterium]